MEKWITPPGRARHRGAPAEWIEIRTGTPADYAGLAHFHYRAGAPATCVRVLCAHDIASPGAPVVGVLLVSMPVLNGPWRNRLWPGVFDSPDPRRRAASLNAGLRCISRVVVDPRYRGLGVARRLVGAYVRDPLTVRTEAVAAMGRVCPFFARAGMRGVPVPRAARDIRLARLLRSEGIRPWRLMDVAEARHALERSARFVHALRMWARTSKQTRGWAEAPERDLWALAIRAAGSLSARPMAYGHEAA